MRHRSNLGILFLLMATLLLSACGDSTPTPPTTSVTTAPAVQTTASAPATTAAATSVAAPATSAATSAAAPATTVATAPTTAIAEVKPEGQIILAGNMDRLRMLNPLAVSFIDQVNLSWHISEGLTSFTPKMEVVPALAEKWETSTDGLTWTFSLRKGVKWHDGKTLTADDVVFSAKAALSEKSKFRGKTQLKDVASIDKVDDNTVKITLKQPVPLLTTQLIALGIVPKAYFGETKDPLADPAFAQKPIGTGPYKVVESGPEKVVLEANQDYWGTKAKIAKVNFIPYTGDLMVGLKNGEINAANYDPNAMKDLLNQGFKVSQNTKSSFHFVALDGKLPLFQDKRTRIALSYALDRNRIIEIYFNGLAVLSATALSPGYGANFLNPKVQPIPYNVKEAGRLLDEIGWKQKAPGAVREAQGVAGVQDGTPLAFTFNVQPNQTTGAQLIQEMWKEAGVNATIKIFERAQIFDVLTGDYQSTLEGVGGWTMDPIADMSAIFSCTEKTLKQGAWNVVHYCNPELDKLFSQGLSTGDTTKRTEIAFKVQEILQADTPFIFVAHPLVAMIANPKLKIDVAGDGKLSPLGADLFMNLWELKK